MKDLEKIKSEDLGCQVADANPGNFGIEQEVAAMVGATVPAPTEPSADDARELGAQLLVFLRRALLPIRSALRTALAAIYSHLDSRCTDYTPAAYAPYQPLPSYDPMGTPPTPRTLPNLLTAITAFSARKISNGSAPNDGIPDGVSLAHLIGKGTDITALIDDNPAWDGLRQYDPYNAFPNLTKIQMNCKTISFRWLQGRTTLQELSMPYLERTTYYGGPFYNCFTATTELNFPSLYRVDFGSNYTPWLQYGQMKKFTAEKMAIIRSNGTNSPMFGECPNLEEIIFPNLGYVNHYGITTKGGGIANNCPKLRRVQLGDLNDSTGYGYGTENAIGFPDCPKLIDLEIGCNGLVAKSVDARWWEPDAETIANPLFLQNFKEHIAKRLTDQGSGNTLTLSQAVRDAIHAAEATYGIEAIIVTQKGWTLSPAPTA